MFLCVLNCMEEEGAARYFPDSWDTWVRGKPRCSEFYFTLEKKIRKREISRLVACFFSENASDPCILATLIVIIFDWMNTKGRTESVFSLWWRNWGARAQKNALVGLGCPHLLLWGYLSTRCLGSCCWQHTNWSPARSWACSWAVAGRTTTGLWQLLAI